MTTKLTESTQQSNKLVTVESLKLSLRDVNNVRTALDYPSITQASKHVGAGEVITMALDEVKRGLSAFNVKTNLNEAQIIMFIEDFLDDYSHESIADLKICLKNARKGQYGTVYNSIDGLVVFGWFKKYLGEKADARENRHINERNEPSPVLAMLNENQLQEVRQSIGKNEEE